MFHCKSLLTPCIFHILLSHLHAHVVVRNLRSDWKQISHLQQPLPSPSWGFQVANSGNEFPALAATTTPAAQGVQGDEDWIKARAAAVGVPATLEAERQARWVLIVVKITGIFAPQSVEEEYSPMPTPARSCRGFHMKPERNVCSSYSTKFRSQKGSFIVGV